MRKTSFENNFVLELIPQLQTSPVSLTNLWLQGVSQQLFLLF